MIMDNLNGIQWRKTCQDQDLVKREGMVDCRDVRMTLQRWVFENQEDLSEKQWHCRRLTAVVPFDRSG